MKQLLIRADDIGYSYAVNLGIARSINEGLVRSAGLMPNMPEAERGWSLVADAGIAVGQHTTCAWASRVPTRRSFRACSTRMMSSIAAVPSASILSAARS